MTRPGDSRLTDRLGPGPGQAEDRPQADRPERIAPWSAGLGHVFIVLALLPWVGFGLNDLDSQPWPLFAGLLFLCGLPRVYIPGHMRRAAVMLLAGLPLAIICGEHVFSFEVGRAMAGYATILVSALAFHNYLRRFGFPARIVRAAGMFWLAMGVIETRFPHLSEALSPARTTLDRGVTSLSPEPTFFAIYLFFSSWLLLSASHYRPGGADRALILANAAAILFLAKSFMGALYLAAGAGAGAIAFICGSPRHQRSRRSRALVNVSAAAMAAVVAVWAFPYLEGTRLHAGITRQLAISPATSVLRDASINQRLEGVALSLHGFVANLGLPGGFDTFYERKTELSRHWGSLFWFPTAKGKIMSWSGSMLYELGLFGLAALTALLAGAAAGADRRRAIEISLFVVLALGAIPHGFPLMPMLLAQWHWNGRGCRLLR